MPVRAPYKTIEEGIYWYYSKFVKCGVGKPYHNNPGMWQYFYKQLKNKEISMNTERDRETRLQMNGKKTCVYCDAPATARDHVIPKVKGGSLHIYNEVNVCKHCNSAKKDKDLIDWWLETHKNANEIPRIPIGIWLKYSYEWNKAKDRLDNPASSIQDLKPPI